jgi:hypothetical protein
MNWALVEERLGELDRARGLYAGGAAVWDVQRQLRNGAWGAVGLAAVQRALGEESDAATTTARACAAFTAAGDAVGAAAAAAQPRLSGRKGGRT